MLDECTEDQAFVAPASKLFDGQPLFSGQQESCKSTGERTLQSPWRLPILQNRSDASGQEPTQRTIAQSLGKDGSAYNFPQGLVRNSEGDAVFKPGAKHVQRNGHLIVEFRFLGRLRLAERLSDDAALASSDRKRKCSSD